MDVTGPALVVGWAPERKKNIVPECCVIQALQRHLGPGGAGPRGRGLPHHCPDEPTLRAVCSRYCKHDSEGRRYMNRVLEAPWRR